MTGIVISHLHSNLIDLVLLDSVLPYNQPIFLVCEIVSFALVFHVSSVYVVHSPSFANELSVIISRIVDGVPH